MEPNPAIWAGRRVGVTGGTGFLGYHLVKQLLALRAEVRVLSLPPPATHPLRSLSAVRTVYGDVRDITVVRQALTDCQVVFHMAGLLAVWGPALQQLQSVHVLGTRSVLAVVSPDTRVIHTSSIVTIGPSSRGEVLDEGGGRSLDVPVDYVRSKRAAEQVCLDAAERGSNVVVTNPGFLIGPEDHGRSALCRACVRFWKGRLPAAPATGINVADVRDVACGHLLAAEHGLPGRRYILGGENRSFPELFGLLAHVAGLHPRIFPRLPGWLLHTLARIAEVRAQLAGREPFPSRQQVYMNQHNWFVRSDRAIHELGYHNRPLAQTLADTYSWNVSTGQLALRGLNRWWMRPETGRRAA